VLTEIMAGLLMRRPAPSASKRASRLATRINRDS
jgi:hypothetical protein